MKSYVHTRARGTPEKESKVPRTGIQRLVVAMVTMTFAASVDMHSKSSYPGNHPAQASATSACSTDEAANTDFHPPCAEIVRGRVVIASGGNSVDSDLIDATLVPDQGARSEFSAAARNQTVASRKSRNPHKFLSEHVNNSSVSIGYTMAEICMTGQGALGSACRIGKYFEAENESADTAIGYAPPGKTISGRVIAADGTPLSGVAIVAAPKRLMDSEMLRSGELRFWTVTDYSGAYILEGLPEGEFTIRSAADGPYASTRIAARTGVDYADLVVPVKFEFVANGRVLTAMGEPLEGVTVTPVLLGQPSVVTDESGHFSLPVALGEKVHTFAVRFLRPGYRESKARIDFMADDGANAEPLNVVMQDIEAWTAVSGRVTSTDGTALPGRVVELIPQLSGSALKSTTDKDGRFQFDNVEAPANYRLLVHGGGEFKDVLEAVSTSTDMELLALVAEPFEFGKVSGQLVSADGVPIPNFNLVMRHTDSRRAAGTVMTDELGNFVIDNAPAGEFVIASQSTPTFLVQGLRLSAGANMHLPLVLDLGRHELRGIVVDSKGNPLPASQVVLKWTSEADGISASATRRTAADSTGQFTFSRLGPGPHFLEINARGFVPATISHDLSRQGYQVRVQLDQYPVHGDQGSAKRQTGHMNTYSGSYGD